MYCIHKVTSSTLDVDKIRGLFSGTLPSDFLTMGPVHSSKRQDNLVIIHQACSDLRVPLAQEKLEGPTHCLTYLVIKIDT